MPIFKRKDKEIYLFTNYKVMYSTLSSQENLLSILGTDRLFLKVLRRRVMSRGSKCYLLVRNPYDRVASFFRDKFRQAVEVSRQRGRWQNCQKIFFPPLGIGISGDPSSVASVMSNTPFSKFVSMLPEVYRFDGHLQPQIWKENLPWPGKIPPWQMAVRFERTYKMEAAQDLLEMADLFDIDIRNKHNSTDASQGQIIWSPHDRRIVEKIYRADFLRYDYQFTSEGHYLDARLQLGE